MARVHFYGRVLPEPLNFTLKNHPTLFSKDADFPKRIIVNVSIDQGQIKIACDVEDYDEQKEAVEVLTRAESIAKISIDLGAFSLGRPLMLIIDKYVGPDGIEKQVEHHSANLAELCTAFKFGEKSFSDMFDLVLADPYQTFALRDLTSILNTPILLPVSCARAIETIRNLVAPNVEPRMGWSIFQKTLNVSPGYVRYITDNSIALRHGDHRNAPKNVSLKEISERSWILANRYFEHRKRGGVPLPIADFPLL